MHRKKISIVLMVLIISCIWLFFLSCGERSSNQEAQQQREELALAKSEEYETGTLPKESLGETPYGPQEEPKDSFFKNFMLNTPPQTVVARIDGTDIKAWVVKDVAKIIMEQVKQQLGTIQPDMEKNLAQMALHKILKSELIYKEAVKEGISASDEEVENIIKNIKLNFPSEEKFQEFLKLAGCSEDELRKEERKKLVIDKYVKGNILSQIKVSEEDAREFYADNKERFKTEDLIKARFILFPLKENASKDEKKEAREKAEEVLKLAMKGEDFGELAKKHSGAPNAEKGGDLGYFPKGVMVANFDKYAFSLEIGEVSEVFETQFGYNILKVEDRKAAGYMNFDDIKGSLVELLTKKKKDESIEKKVESIKNQANIEILMEGF